MKALTKLDELTLQAATHNNLTDFVNNFYRLAFHNWIGGSYVDECCQRMIDNPFLVEITGRGFWKTSRGQAEIIHSIFTNPSYQEDFYFSFNSPMSRKHLTEVKKIVRAIIRAEPVLGLAIQDNKPTAESVIDYTNHAFGIKYQANAFGFFEFFRGLHTDGTIYIDDPLSDPTNKLDPLLIRKANAVYTEQILPIANPTPGVKIRIFGTPQTDQDFFANKQLMAKFEVNYMPALLKDESIWPDRFSTEYLLDRRNEIGDKAFRQEYQAEPVVAYNSYIDSELLDLRIKQDMAALTDTESQTIVCGFDPAKKAHAAHFSAYVLDEDNGRYRQIVSRFWDKTDYTVQLKWIYQFCEDYDVLATLADNTNGVLEYVDEEGILHPSFTLLHFTAKRKQGLIQSLDALITAGKIDLLPDERQRKHILSITNDLDSIETDDDNGRTGHADAGWSNCMAVMAHRVPEDWVKKPSQPTE